MKKYYTPDAKFLACTTMDIITTSPEKMGISSLIPDIDNLPDYAEFN